MDTVTTVAITIESDRGTRMKFQVDHEPHFDLRSEKVDGVQGRVHTLETTMAEPDDGRVCLTLAKLTLDTIIEGLPQESEENG